MTRMLDTTLQAAFIPGTNCTGGLACAPWRFLLPTMRFERALILGLPGLSTMQVLTTLCPEVTVIAGAAVCHKRSEAALDSLRGSRLQVLEPAQFPALSLPEGRVDLIVLAGRRSMQQALQHPALLDALGRCLAPHGTIYFESHDYRQRLTARRLLTKLQQQGLHVTRQFWLTPFGGDWRTAFPLGEAAMARFVFANLLYGQSPLKRLVSRVGTALSQSAHFFRLLPRRAVLVGRNGSDAASQAPPRFLLELASQQGVDLSRYRCGVSARGRYNSNKTIFFLFAEQSSRPELIIKMTRAPEFNFRLENEQRMLLRLQEQRSVPPDTFPEPVFFGHHAGLAICCQRAVHGVPFRSRTHGTSACPFARQAIDWLVQVAAGSAPENRVAATAPAAVLQTLFERFTGLYQLSPAERDFLQKQIARVAASRRPFPSVLQHGDPGTWNMLVSAQGRVSVIDWEAGEVQGMPLWDLFYFMRSYGNWMARRQGLRDALQGFRSMLLAASPLSALLAQTVARYCAVTSLDRALVGPLFFTCWLHRALKEASRLTPATLAEGHYYRLLKLCIAQRQAPGLAALLTVQPPDHRAAVHASPPLPQV
ncbi:MAG: phosphotransferase [candidate division KSB1 bacterium]|nr:phosphotransferase [candidate division KSB1 bacterium]MDZ7276151.1 phosphotransferase [candidate division KSB1 bacterium]MDZ7287069.1 phosphotransferase [candidate division KSB1 bacterium]MDZ7297006.1 phosphotransferase [candidate division KSB1 bacterium]MDZ7307512.1 phosphotransferase [candidate division KSB1 bacterium]